MSPFWRSLFTSQPQRAAHPAPPAPPVPQPTVSSSHHHRSGRKKEHSRSASLPAQIAANAAPKYGYVSKNSHRVTPSASAAPTPHSRPSRKRSTSYGNPAPSPVRFLSSTTSHAPGEHSTSGPIRPSYNRSQSHGSTGTMPYAIYAPSVSYSSSSRTGSATSVRMPPRTESSSSVPRHSFEMRPPLKQHHTWHGDDVENGDKRTGKRSAAKVHSVPVEITPLLASSGRSRRSYIEYDVTFLPSPRSVMNRHTRQSVPDQSLMQPATRQPTTSKLILRSHKFPWIISVDPCQPKPSKPVFYIGSSSSAHGHQGVNPITIADVLQTLHVNLHTPVTQQEWESLGPGSKAQKKVTKAYKRRCSKLGGGWEGGVRRIDWLGSKTKLVGIEVDPAMPDGRTCKLSFSKA